MSNKVGQLTCSFNSKNTGYGSCVEEWKKIAGALIYDSPRTFSKVEIAALEATLMADALNDTKSLRMFPLHGFVGFTDSSENVVIETYNYGPKAIVRDGDYDWTFQFTDGQNCVQQSLRSHNGKRWVLFYDSAFKILGYNKNELMSTIPLQFMYAHPWKAASGTTAAGYMVQFVFLAKYINEQRAFVQANFDPSEITGLQDVDIVVNSWDQNTGIANINLVTTCGGTNLFDEFKTQLANVGNFSAVDQDGNVVAITNVQLGALKSFDITLDTGDLPDNGTVTLSGAAPSVLAAANIEGYEIGSVDLEVVGS